MINFIENTLHIKAKYKNYENSNLPLNIRALYDISIITITEIDFLVMHPKEKISLSSMKKHWIFLNKQSSLQCVLCLSEATSYIKKKMLEEGIPFIIEYKEIYLPFLGIALSNSKTNTIAPIDVISYTTQKTLLTALYNNWKNISSTEAAMQMGVSNMTITRCFNELDAINLSLIHKGNRTRSFYWEGDKKSLWEEIKPILRTPISKAYYLAEKIHFNNFQLGGISALSYYTQICDNEYQTYAIHKKNKKLLPLDKFVHIPRGETPESVVLVTHYTMEHITLFPSNVMDPFSTVLSLSNYEKDDPRVEESIDKLLEEYL